MELDIPERTFGLTITDIEGIIGTRSNSDIEEGVCFVCSRKMYRLPDFSATTPIWNHRSTGRPPSYSPTLHDARAAQLVETHAHEWALKTIYFECTFADCGARKLPPTPPLAPGVFIQSKDKENKAARERATASNKARYAREKAEKAAAT